MSGNLVKFAQPVSKNSDFSDSEKHHKKPWSVLVVDDDEGVHEVTKLTLSSLEFDGRFIEITSAYSAKEARDILSKPNDFSVLLLDVVMETDYAGLDLVNFIRDDLKNQFLRIILRTGQPGQAPELSVIVDYDINDYRTKTELTSEKIKSCVVSALRSYRDINTIKELAVSRENLQRKVLKRNSDLQKVNSKLQAEIKERFAVEKQLAITNSKLESIINNSTALISLKNEKGQYDLVNSSFLETFNLTADQVIGKTDYEFFSVDIAEAVNCHDNEVLESREAIQCEELFPTKNGDHFYLSVKFPLFSSEGGVYRICSICTDITDRLEAQNQILRLAQYDALTELPNRTLFIDRLSQAVSRAQWHSLHVAIMFIDLDRFKNVNDTLGHDIGDKLLVEVANRLQSLLREGDSVCRLGGDEFAVLLTDLASESDIVRMAERIMNSCANFYEIDGKTLTVTPSIGISRCPLDGVDVQVLLKKADTAMYKAKKAGRNAYRFYLAEDDSKANELLALEVDLRKMLTKGPDQLCLLYQPKVNTADGTFNSVEALLRWNHPEKGLIHPLCFIPLLEETGLIIEAGEWVLQEACSFATRFAELGFDMKVAVNLSSRQLKDYDIVSTLQRVLNETRCQPEWLELEVTESTLVHDIEHTKVILDEIAAMGVTLAIDDFGTGYSSLHYLKNLPFNTLKIDRSFIVDAPTVERDRAIVMTIAQLAENLQMGVVAEGVETAEQYNLVKSVIGKSTTGQIQGYLFSKPVTEDNLIKLSESMISTWSKLHSQGG